MTGRSTLFKMNRISSKKVENLRWLTDPGWWLTYPLWKILAQVSWDEITFPMYGKSFKIPWFQSPPTRIYFSISSDFSDFPWRGKPEAFLGPPFDGPIHLSAFHVLLGAMLQGGAPVSDSSRSVGTNHSSFTMVYAMFMPTAGKPYVRFASFLSIALCLGVGVGWGGMLTFLVLRTWYIAMLLRSLGSFTTLRVATLLRSLVWVGVGVGWGGGAC